MPARTTRIEETQIIKDILRQLRRHRANAISQEPIWTHNTFTAPATYQLTSIPYGVNALADNGSVLSEGTDYTVDYTTGLITFTVARTAGHVIFVSYVTNGDLIALSGPVDTGGITDTFNRADNVSLGTTSDGNATWTQQHGFGGTIGIVGNKARLPTATTGERFATVPSGTAGSVQVDVPDSTNASRPAGLTFRYIDSTHFWYVFVNGTSLKVNDPSGSAFVGAGAAGDTLRVDYTTTGFQVFQNGSLVYTRTDSTFNTSTAVGIYVNNGDGIGGGSVDNFSYVPA